MERSALEIGQKSGQKHPIELQVAAQQNRCRRRYSRFQSWGWPPTAGALFAIGEAAAGGALLSLQMASCGISERQQKSHATASSPGLCRERISRSKRIADSPHQDHDSLVVRRQAGPAALRRVGAARIVAPWRAAYQSDHQAVEWVARPSGAWSRPQPQSLPLSSGQPSGFRRSG